MSLALGAQVPQFTLTNTQQEQVTTSDLAGENFVLVFFPFAFSGICTAELCELRNNITAFEQAGVRVFGVSNDPAFSLAAFKQQESYQFELLSDFWPHGEVSKAFGVFDEERGCAVRGSFLFDKTGALRWKQVNALGEARDLDGYLEAVQAL